MKFVPELNRCSIQFGCWRVNFLTGFFSRKKTALWGPLQLEKDLSLRFEMTDAFALLSFRADARNLAPGTFII